VIVRIVNAKVAKMSSSATRCRTACYIDGFNLYYGLKEINRREWYWLDVRAMARELLAPGQVLVATKYFTARVAGARRGDSPEKAAEREASRRRQGVFLEALETLDSLDICTGQYLLKRDHCRACNAEFYRPEEKMTDVRIATELITDAFLGRLDAAIIVSGDSDLVPPIEAIKIHHPHINVTVVFPPKRYSYHLAGVANRKLTIFDRTFARCQMPDARSDHETRRNRLESSD
jgi:uncharacterized LabA/DUF88 family protein